MPSVAKMKAGRNYVNGRQFTVLEHSVVHNDAN
jgi:hypothetical protein